MKVAGRRVVVISRKISFKSTVESGISCSSVKARTFFSVAGAGICCSRPLIWVFAVKPNKCVRDGRAR